MFKFSGVTAAAALLVAALFATPSLAQAERSCPKVSISFKCGDISGNMKAACNAGEGETACCNRVKERLKKRSCKNKDMWFECACPEDADGGASRVLPGPMGTLTSPVRPRQTPATPRSGLTPATPDGPGRTLLQAGDDTIKVHIQWTCKDRDDDGEAKVGCRAGETEDACCARNKTLASTKLCKKGTLRTFDCKAVD